MSNAPGPFDQGPKPRSGREPQRARSPSRLRLGFASIGVAVGVVLAVWAIVEFVGTDEVNPVLVVLALVVLVGSIVNVVGVVRARITDARLRSGRSGDDDA